MKRNLNFSTRKSVGPTFLTFGTRYDELGREREINYWVSFYALFIVITWVGIIMLSGINRIRKFYLMCTSDRFCRTLCIFESPKRIVYSQVRIKVSLFYPPKQWNRINGKKEISNRIKENNIFVMVLTYFVAGP